jgi:hypothetical protein
MISEIFLKIKPILKNILIKKFACWSNINIKLFYSVILVRKLLNQIKIIFENTYNFTKHNL